MDIATPIASRPLPFRKLSMPAFLTLDSISLATPDGRPLFDGLTLALGSRADRRRRPQRLRQVDAAARDRRRELEPAAGSVQRAGSIGMLAQRGRRPPDASPRRSASPTISPACAASNAATGSLDDAAEADWTLEAASTRRWSKPACPRCRGIVRLASLSGGERTRVALARLLIDAAGRAAARRAHQQPRRRRPRRRSPNCSARWRAACVVASHDRALLERVDRIVELTAVGVTIFGGAWPAFAEARDAARARAEADLEPRFRRAAQRRTRRFRKPTRRRPAATRPGAPTRASGGAGQNLFLDAEQQRAENSGARESRIADRLIDDRADALADARARVEILTPLSIELPKTGLPGSRELVAFDEVVMAHGDAPAVRPAVVRGARPRARRRSAAPTVRARPPCFA